ncbi:MAG TPA: transketolase C-terminal domain-containing protein, partial [Anaerolineaceae bacterium]|nr:transketolase C-terminal domain-containing protein [Anaerolineaceae bacterium]
PNPVVFCEHKVLYGTQSVGGRGLPDPVSGGIGKGLGTQVPEEEYTLPLGVAEVKRSGRDVTIIATALMVHRSLAAATLLNQEGIEAEVIDPRTLVPLDLETILGSVSRTHRVMVVTEEAFTGSAGAEIAARIAEDGFDELDAPVVRLNAPDIPLPFAPHLQAEMIPNEAEIVRIARNLVQKQI